MKKELCFVIDSVKVYLEQVLVDYIDVPIFFLCKGNEQYYSALCIDIDELEYIVVKPSLLEVYYLLHGKTPMRDVLLKQKEYWNIISGEEIVSDVVTRRSIDSLDIALLPEENACFQILTKQMREFVQKFDSEFLANKYFDEKNEKVDINEILVGFSLENLIRNIDQFTELVDYKMQKTIQINLPSYDEKLNYIKEAERMNSSQITKSEMADVFELSEQQVNDIATAA